MTEQTALALTTPTSIDEIGRTAKMLAMSGFFDSHQNQQVAMAQIGTKILAGAEYGFGPFASVQGIHIIKGKPVMSANLMAAALDQNPRYDYSATFSTDGNGDVSGCTISITRDGKHVGESEFTLADAKQAGLTNNATWQKFPRNMLFVRAMSNAVRWYAPGVFNGSAVYVEGELDGDDVPPDLDTLRVVESPAPEQVTHTETQVEAEQRRNGTQPDIDMDVIDPDLAAADDNLFEDDERDVAALLRKMHAIAGHVWGNRKNWDAQRHNIARAVSDDRTQSSKELDVAELEHAIAIVQLCKTAKEHLPSPWLRSANTWLRKWQAKSDLGYKPQSITELAMVDAQYLAQKIEETAKAKVAA